MRQGGGLALFLSQQEPKEACALGLALAGRAPGFLLGTLRHTPGLWVRRFSRCWESQARRALPSAWCVESHPKDSGRSQASLLGRWEGQWGCWG